MLATFFTFAQAQSLHDLICVAQSMEDSALRALGGDTLVHVVRQSACRFEREADGPCYEALATAAMDGTEHATLALAVLIANEMQQGLWGSLTTEFAQPSADQIATAPHVLRTAVLRGLDELDRVAISYGAQRDPILPSESRLTRQMEGLLPPICALARQMDMETRRHVAAADYGDNFERHLEALDEVLGRDDCRFRSEQAWYPSEVVELVAHVSGEQGFIPCTALLLANALPTTDEHGWFTFRWEGMAPDYNALPPSIRTTILDGFRYLYEIDWRLGHHTSPNWHRKNTVAHLIPLFDTSRA